MSIVGGDPSLERWEPPRPTSGTDGESKRGARPRGDRRDVWATAALASVGRAGVAAVLVAAGLAAVPTVVSVGLGVAIVLALFLVTVVAWRAGLPGWGTMWAADLLTLGLVVPLAVANGFPASDPGSLLLAEQSVFAQTWLAVAASLALVTGLTWLQERRAPGYSALAALPASLAVPSVLASLADYRDAPILRALALAYAVSALATLVAWPARPWVRRWLPPVAWVIFVLVVLFPARGGTTLAAHGAGVGLGYLVLLLGSATMVVLDPWSIGRLGPSGRPARRRGRIRPPAAPAVPPEPYED